ncbi:MAG TPA: hypothetical protein VMU59_05920 [Caulobacteraceae bacterium]|nr:hypothetical protein [Caulobacteraceae bacterium]
MAPEPASAYHRQMESSAEIRERWRYLRDLLTEQLERFQSGALQLHSHDLNISPDVIIRLKREIRDFDQMIARSEARDS